MSDEEYVCPVCGNFGKTSWPESTDAFDTAAHSARGSSVEPTRLVCRGCGVVFDPRYSKRIPVDLKPGEDELPSPEIKIKCYSEEKVRDSYRGALEEGLEEDAAIEYAANKYGLFEREVQRLVRGR